MYSTSKYIVAEHAPPRQRDYRQFVFFTNSFVFLNSVGGDNGLCAMYTLHIAPCMHTQCIRANDIASANMQEVSTQTQLICF